ncbi:hypothetical protein [Paenibacillus donghaensis]|uniref:Uncharacterized protein n=1 Tax=Paenibacillus donghaensis TaxID=414771 RepID=A0A2Z2KTE8_9BACL|nr:hypothetical protein [Paenibacillus donghaensis]ASA22688.1 hypothetical protein B9T62_18965 [Paenibacillus donghaensis]
MKNQLSPILKVEKSAFEFWNFVTFVLKNQDDISNIINWCGESKTRREIDEYLSKKRDKDILNRIYTVSDFCSHFNKDSKSALEDLFQEPLNDYKVSQLNQTNAIKIFEIHSDLPPSTWFMDFLLYT